MSRRYAGRGPSRRGFLQLLGGSAAATLLRQAGLPRSVAKDAPPLALFTDVTAAAGLSHARNSSGRPEDKQLLLEEMGSGVALFDYDNDGWLDVFLVNGTTLEGFPKGREPINHLYRNKGDGTFEDVTLRAGLAQSGWGQGVCVGDYDNDGNEDLFVSYWGENQLYRNKGNGTFENVTQKARLSGARTRWGTGCAFVDYDRDGFLDLFVANYIDLDIESAPVPDSGLCRYKGAKVACGPPGLPGGKNVLYHNNGNGTFEDVPEKAGITKANGTYGLGICTLDFDNDGWTDIYVANDSNPSALYRNNRTARVRTLESRPAVLIVRMASHRREWASGSATWIVMDGWIFLRPTLQGILPRFIPIQVRASLKT